MTERIVVDFDADGNATVALNRPEVHNAFDPEMVRQLTAALKKLEKDAKVRAVVLTAVGKNFSAGADIGHMRASAKFSRKQNEASARAMAAMFQTLYALKKPTLAAVQGAVRGGGAGLVAACDIALGTATSTFRLTEVRLGIVPAMISPYVVSAIGARQAHRYFLTGEEISAAEAWRIGLLHEICQDGELGTRAGEILGELFQGGPLAVLATKKLIREVSGKSVTPAIVAATAKKIAAIRATKEAQEGLSAFLAKRKAAWAVSSAEKKGPAKA